MEYKIGTVVRFETAHRQLGDDSKCGFLHGHNWKAEITIISSKLNPIGYVVDFKDLKDHITKTCDHKVILNKNDPLVKTLSDVDQKVIFTDGNPTCEILAETILIMVRHLVDVNSTVVVKLYENEDSYAEVHYP